MVIVRKPYPFVRAGYKQPLEETLTDSTFRKRTMDSTDASIVKNAKSQASAELNLRISKGCYGLQTLHQGFQSLAYALLPAFLKQRMESLFLYPKVADEPLPDDLKQYEVYFPSAKSAAKRLGFLNKVFSAQQKPSVLHGLYFPPADASKTTILYCHGNQESLSRAYTFAEKGQWRQAGLGLLLYAYPGYGRSSGRPSQETVLQAARGASQFLEVQGIPSDRQVLVGYSLGASVASHLAAELHPKALILGAPFASIPAVFEHRRRLGRVPEWWFPPHRMVQAFNTEALIDRIRCPLLILHGTADTVCPPQHGKRLYDKAVNAITKHLHLYPEATHASIRDTDFAQQVKRFALSKPNT